MSISSRSEQVKDTRNKLLKKSHGDLTPNATVNYNGAPLTKSNSAIGRYSESEVYKTTSSATTPEASSATTPEASSATTPEVPSVTYDAYEQFLKNTGDRYSVIRDNAITAAENAKKATYAEAEKERQRGVVDARSAFEQNKATYGANAEAVADMGLTGSGYSDHINSQAYATQRAETQAANAQASYTKRLADQTEAQARLEAETTYQQSMLSNEEALAKYQIQKQEAAEQKLIDLVSSGAIEADDIPTYAYKLGINNTSWVNDVASKYADKVEEDDKWSKIGTLISNGIATATQTVDYNVHESGFEATSEEAKNIAFTGYKEAIASGNFDEDVLGDIEMKKKNKQLSEEQCTELIELANKVAISGASNFLDAEGKLWSKEDAEKYKNEINGNSHINPETKRKIISMYREKFKIGEELETEYRKEKGYFDDKIINVYTDDDLALRESFGKFYDWNKKGTKQYKYTTAIIEAARKPDSEGGIPVDSIIQMNYGTAYENAIYTYKGDGIFVKTDNAKDYNVWLPEGYYSKVSTTRYGIPNGVSVLERDK